MWYVIAVHFHLGESIHDFFVSEEEAEKCATYMNSVDSEHDYRVYFEEM